MVAIDFSDSERERPRLLNTVDGYADPDITRAEERRRAAVRQINEKELQVAQLQTEVISESQQLVRAGQAKEAATQASRMSYPEGMSQEAARGYSDMQSHLRQTFHSEAWGTPETLREQATDIALNVSRSMAQETFFPGWRGEDAPSEERITGMRKGLMAWSHDTNHTLREFEESHDQQQRHSHAQQQAASVQIEQNAPGEKAQWEKEIEDRLSANAPFAAHDKLQRLLEERYTPQEASRWIDRAAETHSGIDATKMLSMYEQQTTGAATWEPSWKDLHPAPQTNQMSQGHSNAKGSSYGMGIDV
jgi:hypothetical protein